MKTTGYFLLGLKFEGLTIQPSKLTPSAVVTLKNSVIPSSGFLLIVPLKSIKVLWVGNSIKALLLAVLLLLKLKIAICPFLAISYSQVPENASGVSLFGAPPLVDTE
ncbi:hypothetical protein D3C87_1789730 [compost metagenome]